MTENLQGTSTLLHPDFKDVMSENGTFEELGEGVLNKLRDEYLREGLRVSDAKKIKDITSAFGVNLETVFSISGVDGLGLHDNYLAATFLKMHVSEDPKKLRTWLNTSKISLDHKTTLSVILEDKLPKVVGYVFDAYNVKSNA